jgi:type II secretory pathway pseudopilin PulG
MKHPAWARKSKVALLVLLLSGLFVLLIQSTYRKSIKRAMAAVSGQDLAVMRQAIKNYTTDKERPPQSLQDLLDEHCLQVIPTDPLTGKKDWVPHFGNVVVGPGKTSFGVDDVHSITHGEDMHNND